MKATKAFFLLLLVLSSILLHSQELTPPIQNHTTVDYDAASQNWDISISEEGIVYAANNQGLLSYDGQRWELLPLKSGSIVRSVHAEGDRIYTGSYKEFGYWSRNDTGKMVYTSLTPLLKEHSMQSEEFWEILPHRGGIYFRSFGAIYRYKNNRIESVRQVISNEMVSYGDRLVLGIETDGVFYLNDDGSVEPLPDQDLIIGERVVDMEVNGEDLLIGTRDALFEFKSGRVRKITEPVLNKYLEAYELNKLKMVSETEIVIGTVKNGILHYDFETGEISIYNRNSGLQNNTILGMAVKNGKVWLGLDNGIDEINLNSSISFYTDRTGELGAVYDLQYFDSSLFLASNTGVYFFNDDKIELVEGSEGHSWNFQEINEILHNNHNSGTFTIEEKQFISIDERTGSYCFQRFSEEGDLYLIGTYTGISLYDFKDQQVSQIRGINFPVKKILLENPSTIWAAHPYEGVYRINLSPDGRSCTNVEKIQVGENPDDYKVEIFRINNQLALLKNNNWYKYNSFRDRFEDFSELDNLSNHRFLLEEKDGAWFINTVSNSIVFTDFKNENLTISFDDLNRRLVKGNEELIRLNDSIYYVALNDGFARFNLKTLKERRVKDVPGKIILKGFKDESREFDLTRTPSIPFKDAGEITFLAALPGSDSYKLHYELMGENKLEGVLEKGSLTLYNLSRGDYLLRLSAVGPQGEIAEVSTFNFSVQPPWYLSTGMKLVYFLFFLVILGMVYWYNRTKLRKHQKLLEQKFEKEHQERINNIEKERLRNEITLKRKELANTTMVAAKKNEVLMEIQGELNKDKDKFSNQFRLKHIMNKINQAVKSKDEWKVFETNFSEVHEDFFKDLLEKYPQLTNKDLKLCSYLKMNLSSKEIAPLMGISVRGVEVHRYRLRKKMNLESSENLTNYFIKNF